MVCAEYPHIFHRTHMYDVQCPAMESLSQYA